MRDKILKTIQSYNMLDDCKNLVAAVSGGADSMCLLHFLYSAKEELNINLLIAAHVNHNIRGEEAKRDENFVRSFCVQHDIPFRLLDVDIPFLAHEKKCGTEQMGREVRYDFFKSLSQEYNALVATAHNADDNVETLIYHLARGSALRGLCGIPPKREYIIRPLLELSREEVERYCREYGIDYVTDSTNLADDYTRNKIRHNVIPTLKQINPSLESTVIKAVRALTDDEEYLTIQAQKALKDAEMDYGYNVSKLRELPRPILSRAVVSVLEQISGISADYDMVASVISAIKQGKRVNIKEGVFADAKSGVFRIYSGAQEHITESHKILGESEFCFDGKMVRLSLLKAEDLIAGEKFNNLLFKNKLDYDIITADTVIRTRRSKDTFSPRDRGFTKSLKKFLIDEKVAAEKRGELLLIANGSQVLWIEGFGVSEQAKATKNTKRVLYVEIVNESKRKKNE